MDTRTIERRGMAVAAVLAVLGVGAATLGASRAAFSATARNSGNRVATGTIDVAADRDATLLFAVDRMTPGTTQHRCTRIRYTGTAPADVRLHADATGALAEFLDVLVEVGAASPGAAGGCDGFTPSRVVFKGDLARLAAAHGSFRTGVGGFEQARPGESRRYRITTTLRDDAAMPAPQGAGATADLTWEAAP